MSSSPTVFVVDDDEIVLHSLRAMLAQRGYHVRVFSSAGEFLSQAELDLPGCVVTDLQMPQINGVELQRRLAAQGSVLSVVVVTGVADVPTAIDMMKRGAVTLLEKPYDHTELLRSVASGLYTSEKRWQRKQEERDMRAKLATLSDEERMIMKQLLSGALNKSVASSLKLSLRTMDRRRRTILQKMGVESIPELALKFGKLSAEVELPEPAEVRVEC